MFFDWKGKGKVKKAHFINGLEKLRARLSASDIDLVWNYLDVSRKGFINFNDFCAIARKPSPS